MTRLVHLYPAAWRERYGAEFEALLEEWPPSVADRFDIVRGAVDAWLRPQVRRRSEVPGSRAGRSAASVMAIIGGFLFLIAAVSLVSQGSPLEYRDARIAQYGAWIGALLIALGPLRVVGTVPSSGPGPTLAFAASLAFAFCIAGPWPIVVVGIYGFALLSVLVGLWRLVTGGPVWALVVIGSLLMPLVNTEDDRAWLLVPFGLAWIVLGVLGLAGRPWVRPLPARATEGSGAT